MFMAAGLGKKQNYMYMEKQSIFYGKKYFGDLQPNINLLTRRKGYKRLYSALLTDNFVFPKWLLSVLFWLSGEAKKSSEN